MNTGTSQGIPNYLATYSTHVSSLRSRFFFVAGHKKKAGLIQQPHIIPPRSNQPTTLYIKQRKAIL